MSGKRNRTSIADTLHFGDCREVIKEFDDEVADLIYLDPPFNSNVGWNVLYGSNKRSRIQAQVFGDMWYWDELAAERVNRITTSIGHPLHNQMRAFQVELGNTGMLSYVSYFADLLPDLRRINSQRGVTLIHCDHSACPYLWRLLIAAYGAENYVNDIVWCYSGGGVPKKGFARKHDYIIAYAKDIKEMTFNRQYAPYSAASAAMGKGYIGQMLDLEKGKAMDDWWIDIKPIAGIRRTLPVCNNYPTQKPPELLDRIVSAFSNEGDIVLDPFGGSGTTAQAAHRQRRRFVSIDIMPYALQLSLEGGLPSETIVEGEPMDIEGAKMLAIKDCEKFQRFAITRINGLMPNEKMGGDGGIDGRGIVHNMTREQGEVVAQVTGSRKFNIDKLRGFMQSSRNHAFAIYITLGHVTSREARAMVAERGKIQIGANEYPRAQLWSMDAHFKRVRPELPPLADPFNGRNPAQGDMFKR